MRTTTLIAAATATLAAALTTFPAAPSFAAKPKLDTGFGLHHGYWLRTDGLWANATTVAAAASGTALVTTDDARFARIGADGKADGGWGSGGVVTLTEPGRYTQTVTAARWDGRYLLVARNTQRDAVPTRVRVVDARGRVLPVTDAVQAALPTSTPAGAFYEPERLVPAADGRLWDLRLLDIAAPPDGSRLSLAVLDASGVPLTQERINLVSLPSPMVSGPPVASGNGLVLGTYDPTTHRSVVRRMLADGRFDPAFRPLTLPDGTAPRQMLPWQGGVVLVSNDGRVRWVTDSGRVVHSGKLPSGSLVAFDTARRIVGVAGSSVPGTTLTVRRLHRNGSADPSFGVVTLRAAGRRLRGLGVVPASGGRLLVVASSVKTGPGYSREDYDVPHATVVWRLRTR